MPCRAYSSFDIFQWLSSEAQAAFVRSSRRRHFADGRVIYAQGEAGTDMYRIVSGSVRLSVVRSDGREALYLLLGTGDCFGVCSLADAAPRHQTASANGDVELLVLGRDAYERLRSEHTCLAEGLIRHMSRHMRLLNEYFASYTLDELSVQVALRLLNAQAATLPNEGDRGLTVCLSQSEVALMVGSSRQSVNKILNRFQDEGLIAIGYGGLRVLDIDGLQSLTGASAI